RIIGPAPAAVLHAAQCPPFGSQGSPHRHEAVAAMSLVLPPTFLPWFRSVAPYIHAHRGKTFVVGIAGELIAAGKLNTFVQDLALIHAMGIKVVLVHGFRPQVEEQLKAKGQTSRFSQ